jgi:hypothetical protein
MKRSSFLKSMAAVIAAPLVIVKAAKPALKQPEPIKPGFKGLIPTVMAGNDFISSIGFPDQRDIDKTMANYDLKKSFGEIMRLKLDRPGRYFTSYSKRKS